MGMDLFYYDIGIKVIGLLLLLLLLLYCFMDIIDYSLVFMIVYLWYCIIICIV